MIMFFIYSPRGINRKACGRIAALAVLQSFGLRYNSDLDIHQGSGVETRYPAGFAEKEK
jgi:hypothetical protein